MKIHAYILCYNEEDIIFHTLSYYSSFCSRIFLLDNYSTDGSIDIASTFEKVTILPWWSDNKLNDYKNVEVKQSYYKIYSRPDSPMCVEPADWVITCDMDEIVYHPQLLPILEGYTRQAATVANIVGFNMVSDKNFCEIDSLVDSVKMGVQAKAFNKPVLFAVRFDMIFSMGCHPYGVGYDQMLDQPFYKKGTNKIALLHYKYIGERSIIKAKSSILRLSQENINNNLSGHYQKTTKELVMQHSLMRRKARKILDDKGEIAFGSGV